MKRTTCLVLAALLCFLFAGCNSAAVETNAELESQYDYYSASATKLRNEMGLTPDQADAAFQVLVQCGMDGEITYIFDKKDADDNAYYQVYFGSKSFDVYLKDGAIETVKQYNKVLYPEGVTEANTSTEKTTIETSAPTVATASATETITKKTTTAEGKTGKSNTKEQTTKRQKPTTTKKASEQKYTVILNTSTHVYHLRECQAAKKIKAENRSTMTGTIAEIEAAGYHLCGHCK